VRVCERAGVGCMWCVCERALMNVGVCVFVCDNDSGTSYCPGLYW